LLRHTPDPYSTNDAETHSCKNKISLHQLSQILKMWFVPHQSKDLFVSSLHLVSPSALYHLSSQTPIRSSINTTSIERQKKRGKIGTI